MPINEVTDKMIEDCKTGRIKYVIFDRDATLTASSTEEGGYITKLGQIALIDGVKKALNDLAVKGITLLVFTQQKCVGKGLITEDMLHKIHDELNEQLAPARIAIFKYCPHVEADKCSCMKPQPQMITELIAAYNIKPEEVLVVGDNPRDFECAQNAGLGTRFIYVEDDLGRHKEVYAAVKANGGLCFETVGTMVNKLFVA